MPSLRMKKNPSVCCLREKDCLHVCKMSNMVAKRACSHLKISHLAAEIGTSRRCHDVSSSSELTNQDTKTTEATNCDDVLSGEDIQFKWVAPSSDDCFVIEGKELSVVSCSANLATIFSPTLGDVDSCDRSKSYDSIGCNNSDQDPFMFSTSVESDGNSGSSSDHQTCNISDFYISDMVLAGLPFDGSSLRDGVVGTPMFPEYDTAESNIVYDISDGCVTSNFLDDFSESSERLGGQPCGETRGEYESSSFMLAIHQIRPGAQESGLRPCAFDEVQYFDPHSFIRNLPDLSDVEPNGKPSMLPKELQEKKPVTLVLDLDETLVHSTLEQCEDSDFTFTVFFNMKEHTVYVKERPHLREFLKKVASMFEVVVFTASQSIYAEQLLDILDPDGKLISGRAYRESCIFSDGSYTKDLTVLGLDLAKVVIIDNSPQVFRLQVNNGIPIKSWFDDPLDNELFSLIPFLETLADADDVRPLIAKRFGNKE